MLLQITLFLVTKLYSTVHIYVCVCVHVYATPPLSICLSMDISVASMSWVL